ncbi:sodium:solute symporter family transporter [Sphingobacterium chuzhouense]|uniref:Sodium/solute symporter n=1 Tax=Sphingobacterium chuzhouense TaxID=1742264 RepID=A0ABR7XT36_9SPHI|nr:sodium/solute symporter [Sphingobacterium chuzhouense]MBD1422333.1 sodium/solute symporter [Sphingobacterium chuzhouense]
MENNTIIQHSANHLGWVDYSIFVVYLLITIAIGLYFSKGQRDIKEYLMAGKSMKSLVVAITVMVSVFSGISFLGFPAEVYSNGMGYSLLAFTSFVTTPIVNSLFMPFFHRVKLFSAYQYLEARFTGKLRTTIAVIFLSRTLLWASLVIYAPALALEHVSGFPLWVLVLVMGVITTFYTTLGGMKAVIWGDVMQFIVLMGGLIAILVVALLGTQGGLAGVWTTGMETGHISFDFSLDPAVRVTVWGIILGGSVHNLVLLATDQTSIQRYMTAKDIKTAKKSMWIKAYVWVPCAFLFYLTGLVIYTFYQGAGYDPVSSGAVRNVDQILPYFVVNEMPKGFAGLIIAGIAAASMSSISSGVNSMTTVSLVDLIEPYAKRETDEKKKVRYARTLTVVYGIVITLVAFSAGRFGSLLEAPVRIFGLLGGPLLGLFLLGMLSARANAQGATIGWLSSTLITLVVVFATDISFLWYAVIGLVTCYVIGWCFSYLWPKPSDDKTTGFVWKSRFETNDDNQ